MTSWDPSKYLRFGDERTRPAVDLASRIALDAPTTVVDLGCGPGNSTQVLRQRWPGARVYGLDSSPEMIASAKQSHPDQEWILAGVEWISSTGLRPFFDARDLREEKQRFVALLTERVTGAYAVRSDGRVLFPFRRTFVIAYA